MANSIKMKSSEEWNAEYKREVQLFAFRDIITQTCIGLQSANVNMMRACFELHFSAISRIISRRNAV